MYIYEFENIYNVIPLLFIFCFVNEKRRINMNRIPFTLFLLVYCLNAVMNTNQNLNNDPYFTSSLLRVVDNKITAGLPADLAEKEDEFDIEDYIDDPVFKVVTSTVSHFNRWVKRSVDSYCYYCKNGTLKKSTSGSSSPTTVKFETPLVSSAQIVKNETKTAVRLLPNKTSSATSQATTSADSKIMAKSKSSSTLDDINSEVLDCGKPVNFTYYDNLVGVANRMTHPNVPEPQMTLIFKKKANDFDIDALERKLKKTKREKPKSLQLYNQIGNFWRIKGDTYKSIECFRRALAVSPHNAEVLLNLARVLYNLQYLDDAIYLTRRSLEVQPPDKSAWQHYFTLGEIFKAYGHYQEASLHMRHCLQLKPGFELALKALHDMEAIPDSTIHAYTLIIIVCLVLGVLLVIVSSIDGGLESDYASSPHNERSDCITSPSGQKGRHFNRAMAMRSIKMGISPRAMRSKRHHLGG